MFQRIKTVLGSKLKRKGGPGGSREDSPAVSLRTLQNTPSPSETKHCSSPLSLHGHKRTSSLLGLSPSPQPSNSSGGSDDEDSDKIHWEWERNSDGNISDGSTKSLRYDREHQNIPTLARGGRRKNKRIAHPMGRGFTVANPEKPRDLYDILDMYPDLDEEYIKRRYEDKVAELISQIDDKPTFRGSDEELHAELESNTLSKTEKAILLEELEAVYEAGAILMNPKKRKKYWNNFVELKYKIPIPEMIPWEERKSKHGIPVRLRDGVDLENKEEE
ncbi:hypothetical protein ABW19_dt0210167 [Dactylella cylindrospora]|nr:hypothetical protein ABW19_dt0210167 [Dactylella cylindrospora]